MVSPVVKRLLWQVCWAADLERGSVGSSGLRVVVLWLLGDAPGHANDGHGERRGLVELTRWQLTLGVQAYACCVVDTLADFSVGDPMGWIAIWEPGLVDGGGGPSVVARAWNNDGEGWIGLMDDTTTAPHAEMIARWRMAWALGVCSE